MNIPRHSFLAIGINVSQQEKITIKKTLEIEHITLDTASIKDIKIDIIKDKINLTIENKDITKYDYVWIQSGWTTSHMAYLVHLYLKYNKVPHNRTNTNVTKLSDIFFLASKGISVPNTYFQNGLKITEKEITEIENVCGFPCIYKILAGSLGVDVFLIESKEDIKRIVMKNRKFNKYIFQEFIPNEFDYRVVVSNNEPLSVCKRIRVKDKYRNNVALGAKEVFMDIKETPKNVLEMAIDSARALRLKWAGVDIISDKNTKNNYVLEVNRRPGLTRKSTEIQALYSYLRELV